MDPKAVTVRVNAYGGPDLPPVEVPCTEAPGRAVAGFDARDRPPLPADGEERLAPPRPSARLVARGARRTDSARRAAGPRPRGRAVARRVRGRTAERSQGTGAFAGAPARRSTGRPSTRQHEMGQTGRDYIPRTESRVLSPILKEMIFLFFQHTPPSGGPALKQHSGARANACRGATRHALAATGERVVASPLRFLGGRTSLTPRPYTCMWCPSEQG